MNQHASTPATSRPTSRRRLAAAGASTVALALALCAGGCAKEEKSAWEEAADKTKEAAAAVGEATKESAQNAAEAVEIETKRAWEFTKEGVKEITPGSEDEEEAE